MPLGHGWRELCAVAKVELVVAEAQGSAEHRRTVTHADAAVRPVARAGVDGGVFSVARHGGLDGALRMVQKHNHLLPVVAVAAKRAEHLAVALVLGEELRVHDGCGGGAELGVQHCAAHIRLHERGRVAVGARPSGRAQAGADHAGARDRHVRLARLVVREVRSVASNLR